MPRLVRLLLLVVVLLAGGSAIGQTCSRFALGSSVPLTTTPVSMVVGDLNHDGLPDVTLLGTAPTTLESLQGTGAGTFLVNAPLQGVCPYAASLDLGDTNGDGILDLITGNSPPAIDVCAEPVAYVGFRQGTGTGGFGTETTQRIGTLIQQVLTTDLDGDGVPDVVVADLNSYAVVVAYGNGTGTFSQTDSIPLDGPSVAAVAADFTLDGQMDIAVLTLGLPRSELVLLANNGNRHFNPTLVASLSESAIGLVMGDFTGAGRPDIVVLSATSLTLFHNNGDGTFRADPSLTIGSGLGGGVAADFDGNGTLDLAITDPASNTTLILYNDGAGQFWCTEHLSSAVAGPIVAADWAGTGTIDLAIAQPNGILLARNTPDPNGILAGILPIVGTGPGANDSAYATAFTLWNPTPTAATATLIFHPIGSPGSSTGDPRLQVTLAPFSLVRYADIGSALGAPGFGSLDLFSSTAAVRAVATVFDTAHQGATPVVAQSLVPLSAALTRGDHATISGPADGAAQRCNIGLRSLASGATISLVARDHAGAFVGAVTRTLGPNVLTQQPTTIIPALAGREDYTLTVEVLDGSAIAYGAVVTNATGTALLQLAR